MNRKDKFHDRGYKMLFSHPQMVEDLLKSFVKEDFVNEIDFSTLKKVNASFVTEEFSQRESDIIWQADFRGKKAYIYLLIEFQSTVDHFMAIRMLSYIMLFYLDMVKQNKLKSCKKLPVVFPIMLYNGDEKWNSPEKISELIELPAGSLKPYIPEFRYYRISENDFSEEDLTELDSVTSRLFSMENTGSAEIANAFTKAGEIMSRNLSDELKRDFGIWIRRTFRTKDQDIDFAKLTEKEIRPMLEKTIENFGNNRYYEGKQEGKLEGKREGKQEGRLEGKREGKQEGKLEEKMEVARKLMGLGVEMEKIAEATGISVKELKQILH